MPPHRGHLRTSGMGVPWSFLRKVALGVAFVPDRSFPWIVGLVVVLVPARPFSPTVGLGLFRGPVLWVMLFLILVSVCDPNRLPSDCLPL